MSAANSGMTILTFLTVTNPLLRVYINQYFSMHLQFDIQLQCIQISTRINSSMYIRTYVFVSFETTPVVRI